MQPAQRNNLILLAVGGLSFVVITLLAALMTGRQPQLDREERASTFFTDPSGTRATFLVLQRLLPEVEVWRRPLLHLSLPEEGGPSTLVVSAPTRALLSDERDALLTWIDGGGQLILALERDWELEPAEKTDEQADEKTDEAPEPARSSPAPDMATSPVPQAEEAVALPSPSEPASQATAGPASQATAGPASPTPTPEPLLPPFLQSLGIVLSPASAEERKVRLWESRLHTAPLSLYLRAPSTLTGPGEPLLTREQSVAGLSRTLGKGRVVVLGDAAFFSNRSLRKGDNLVFLVHLIEQRGGGLVAFDEFHHGFGEPRSLTSLVLELLETPYGWVLAQLGVALLLYLLGVKRRQGRVVPEKPPVWGSPLLLVRARAGLLQHAQARGLAMELMMQQLSAALSKVMGRALELELLRTHVLARFGTPSLEEKFDALLALQRRLTGTHPRVKDAELVQTGQLVSQILQEVHGERNV